MSFHGFTFAVAESQAGEINPCLSFCGVKLSQMVADPRKPRKFKLKHIRYQALDDGLCNDQLHVAKHVSAVHFDTYS